MVRRGGWQWLAALAACLVLRPASAENGYRNVINERYATVADGPMGGVVVDVGDPRNPAERLSRMRRPTGRAFGRREPPPWFKLLQKVGLLSPNQPAPALPQTVVQRYQGRLLLPELSRSRQADTLGKDDNKLTFIFTPGENDNRAVPWSATQLSQMQAFLATVVPLVDRVWGPPAFNLTVRFVHDPALNDLNMGVYDASANEIRLELLNDVISSNPAQTAVDEYDYYVLTMLVLRAYRDDAMIFFDAWEDGMVRAAQLLVIAEARPDFGFLGRDFNLLYSAYDVLNQPGLESPSFLGAEPGVSAQTLREALAVIRAYLAQACWLKVYAENPDVFRQFNDAYLERRAVSSDIARNIPRLKVLMGGIVPQVEGLAFSDWYRRQYVLDTAVVPGGKLYVFNIPSKDFITGEATNFLPMNVYHFETTPANEQLPLTGSVTFDYTAFDGFDLNAAVEGASGPEALEAHLGEAGNEPGLASAVPLFFNIAGDQGVQQQRISVLVTANGMNRLIWFANDVAADDQTQVRNQIYGLVTNGFQGTLKIDIAGRDPIETDVIQGAFRAKVPGGLPVPAKATFEWTPEGNEGSQVDALVRNVMFLGFIGSGKDAQNGDAVIVLETPPEIFQNFKRSLPAGLQMITIPAYATRHSAAEVLGVDATKLLLARADSAVTTFQSWRLNDLYRLWPDTPAFRPGYAYWFKALEPLELDFEGVEASREVPYRQHYPPGWVQFGNPYTDLNIALRDVKVQAVDGSDAVSLAEAQTRGLISSGVFRYNPGSGGYELLTPDAVLTPFEGFWINVLTDRGVTLVYPNQTAVGRTAPARRRDHRQAGEANRWQLSLVAAAPGHLDADNVLGVAPGAGEGYTYQDVAEPPPFGPYLAVSFPHTTWGGRSGRYAVDLRDAGGGAKSWDVLVESNLSRQPVTLSWPDLAGVPSDVALFLTDLETGTERYMRTTRSYTFESDAGGGARQFRITAQRGGAGRLSVAQLFTQPSRGGGSVSFTLTAPAEVTVLLRSQAGRLLRTLASGRAARNGANEVAFVPIDDQGRPLPRGVYQLELVAVGADGQQARATRLVRVER